MHLDAAEHGDSVVFLHALRDGPANQSYGLQVAALAGVPKSVIRKARTRLEQLERQARQAQQAATPQLGLFEQPVEADRAATVHPVVEQLRTLEVDELSPREALDLLYRLHAEAGEPDAPAG